jgi:hypothetical protein
MGKRLLILVVLLAIFIVLGLIVGTFDGARQPAACTLEAKLCPDGSSVGRSGPKCEFDPCPNVSAGNNIRVYQPVSGETVGQPLVVAGQARVFENAFSYRLLDGAGRQLAAGFDHARASDVGQYGAFSITIEYVLPQTATGTVEVFTHSAVDGSVVDLVSIPVTFSEKEFTAVKVFFDNPSAKYSNPETGLVDNECDGVFPVARTAPKTTAVARAALEQLLFGPTEIERRLGYATAINPGVRIRSLKIVDGVATVDLSSELTAAVGGSCRVTIIARQIELTLKQFETIKSVNLLVDGAPDALQP